MRRPAAALAAAVALVGPAATSVASIPDGPHETTLVAAAVTGARDGRKGLRTRRVSKSRRALRGRVIDSRARLGAAIASRPPPASGGAPGAPAPDSSSPSTPPGADPPPPPPPPPPAGSGRSVQARTDDRTPSQLKLVLSRTTVLAGDVKVEFNNAFAEDPHDLLVERVDGTGAAHAFDELGPGRVQRRTLALDTGEWRLRCTLPTHTERGMTATLTVAG